MIEDKTTPSPGSQPSCPDFPFATPVETRGDAKNGRLAPGHHRIGRTRRGFALGLRARAFPLGVAGEWEWLRLTVSPSPIDVCLAALGVAGYSLIAGFGMAALRKHSTPAREAVAIVALLAASIGVQVVAHGGAPAAYGLPKWVMALHHEGSNGFFTVAKKDVHDPWTFVAAYPEWIQRQDALHIGTHPPGLILVEAVLLRSMESSPASAKWVEAMAPESVAMAFRIFGRTFPMSSADRATLLVTGFLTLLACGGTVIPLYWLARTSLSAPYAWAVAALWPLVPSAILFQPAPDTAFCSLSTTALALAATAGTGASPARRRGCALLAGLVLGIGMQFTLAFLAVGLIVAIVLLADREATVRARLIAVVATGLGFLGFTLAFWIVTGANPFVVWWWNQKNHARFYVEFPRSYRAWVIANPIELAVGIGLPAALWASLSLAWPREIPRVCVATAVVLVLLTLGGRNLSEVARLWLPFMPTLLVAAGSALERLGAGPKTLAATIALIGVETLVLEAAIQVVYPV